MKLKNRIFGYLAERGLIEEKYEHYTDEEKRAYDDLQEEFRKANAGEEIKPLWGNSDGGLYLPSWSGAFKHGGYTVNIWHLFWDNIDDIQKQEYLIKHQAPPEDWYQKLVVERSLGTEEKWKWLDAQKARVKRGEEIEPPWITFPISLPDVGWDDYFLESWKLNVWIPFWSELNEKEKSLYLAKWQPPTKEWEENITIHWVGKIRKSDQWFARQKFFLENQHDWDIAFIFPPWSVFPKIPAKGTYWDTEYINQWLNEIWLSLWNAMNAEKQDKYLTYIDLPNDEWMEILARYEVKNFNKLGKLKSTEIKG